MPRFHFRGSALRGFREGRTLFPAQGIDPSPIFQTLARTTTLSEFHQQQSNNTTAQQNKNKNKTETTSTKTMTIVKRQENVKI